MGSAMAVRKAFFFRLVPPRETYARPEMYPPTLHGRLSKCNAMLHWVTDLPKRDQTTIITVASEPRFDGDRNPKRAKTKRLLERVFESRCQKDKLRVTATIAHNCVPFPTITARRSECLGERKTSPATSFHPQSSCTSSCTQMNAVARFKKMRYVHLGQWHCSG